MNHGEEENKARKDTAARSCGLDRVLGRNMVGGYTTDLEYLPLGGMDAN